MTANRVDTKKLQTVYPEVYKECAKPSQSRRFTVKEIKQHITKEADRIINTRQ